MDHQFLTSTVPAPLSLTPLFSLSLSHLGVSHRHLSLQPVYLRIWSVQNPFSFISFIDMHIYLSGPPNTPPFPTLLPPLPSVFSLFLPFSSHTLFLSEECQGNGLLKIKGRERGTVRIAQRLIMHSERARACIRECCFAVFNPARDLDEPADIKRVRTPPRRETEVGGC